MNDFIDYLEQRGFANTTQKSYLTVVNRFTKWYAKDLLNCTQKDILKYLEHLKNTGQTTSNTQNSSLTALRHYFNYLVAKNLRDKNPTNLIKIRGIKRKFLYHILSSQELTQLVDDYYINFIKNYDDTTLSNNQKLFSELSRNRNYSILSFLIYQGVNTNEIATILLNDIDFQKATISIKATRKSNARKLPLKAEQIGFLMNYIHNIRPQFLAFYAQETEQLFLLLPLSIKQQRIPTTNYNNLFSKLSKSIQTLHPNYYNFRQIRTSVITHWLKVHGIRKTQNLAGHRYISSTEKYQINDLESLTEDIATKHPF